MGEMIKIHQQSGTVQAYLAVPQKATRYNGAVIVGHELWGLTEQIKQVADRFAAQGYYALAPDLYSTDKENRRPSEELQRELFSPSEHVRYNAMPKLRAMIAPTQTPQFMSLALSRLASCFEYAYNQPLVHQRVAMVGFGLGGNYAFSMAMREQRLKGVVSFYGHAPRITAELRHIRCPILAFYGKKEQSLYKELNTLAPRMKMAGVDFKAIVYANAGHAFFNDANSFAFSPSAADDAWRQTVSFLREQMGATVV
jgi:carboxymethylenebutenolidase